MLGAVASFVAMAALVKILRESGLTTWEVMFWRVAPTLPWVYLELRLRGLPIWPRRPGVIGLRSLFGGAAMGTYFWAIRSLTLAQHTVLHLAQPVFVASLSPVILRERLRGAAIVALALALLGALAVIRPDQALAGVAVVPLVPGLVGLTSALLSGLAHMMIRLATGREPTGKADPRVVSPDAPETVVFHFTLHVSLVTLVIGLADGGFRGLPEQISTFDAVWQIALMAGLGGLGQLMMSRAYARTQAPAVAVVAYAGIPLTVALDYLIWGAPLTLSSLVGAVLMVVAGLLLVRSQPRTG